MDTDPTTTEVPRNSPQQGTSAPQPQRVHADEIDFLATDLPKKGDTAAAAAAAEAAADAEREDATKQLSDEERAAEREREEAQQKHEDDMEILEPLADPRRWVVGKPPEKGGSEDEYSIYVQEPLAYMARLRFFSMVSGRIAQAIKQGATLDLVGDSATGNFRQRAVAVVQDFDNAGSFMTLAAQLMEYSPDFLLDCYCLWMNVPRDERRWAKTVMDMPWDPDRNKWGLKDSDHEDIVNTFLDQNYEEMRRFFAETLPRYARRVQQIEKQRAALVSESAQSKQ